MSNPQAEPVTGATDPSVQLGGNTSPSRLNAAEITIICVTVVGFILAMVLIFYCKQLEQRRNIAMAWAAEDAERAQAELEQRGSDQTGGVELKDLTLLGGGNGLQHSVVPSLDEAQIRVNAAKFHIEKPPLWKFINKKYPPLPSMSTPLAQCC
jgi:hypothetical protein